MPSPGRRCWFPLTHVSGATQRARERLHLLAWFISLGVILNLAGRVLEASQEVEFTLLTTWLAVSSLLVLLGGSAVLAATWRKTFVWPRWLWRFSGLGVAALISLSAVQLSFHSTDPAVTWYQTIPLWLLAVVAALLAAWPRHEAPIPFESTPRRETITLLGILTLSFLLRVIDLHGLPAVLMGDESKFALQARDFNQGLLFQPFQTAIDGHWGLWFMVLGAFTRLFGETVEAIRLHAVIFGTLSILATYAVTRLLWGRRPALIAAALLATYHFHIHFSRNAMNNIYDALFAMLIFGLFWLGWLKQRRWPWLLGALALGVAQYFYIGGRVILAQVAVLALFWLITDRSRVRAQLLNIALAVGVFTVVAVPGLYFAQLRPNEYMTRFNQTNIVRNGWLDAAMQERQTGALQVLAQQAGDTLQVFIGGPDSLFYQGQSLLTPIMSVLALGGLLYLLRHFKEGRAFWLLSSLGLILIIGGVFTLTPLGGAHHFVGTAPLIYIAIAVFIDRVWGWAAQRRPARQRILGIASVVFITALMVTDAYYYFGIFATNQPTFSPDAEQAMRVGEYLHDLEQRPETFTVICVYAPHMWCSHDSVIFLAPRLGPQAHDLSAPPSNSDLTTPSDQELIVIVAPDLPDDLAAVQAHFPTITPRSHYGIHGDLLFTSFEIPASQP
jgi:Dolichyl-phosphate-mannose-protein mannosyltransferase